MFNIKNFLMGILIVNTVYQVNASESNQVVPKNDNSELMMLKQKRFDDFSITTNALNINDKQVNQEIDQKMEDNKIEDDLSHYMDNDFNEIHNGGNNSINEHNDVNNSNNIEEKLAYYSNNTFNSLEDNNSNADNIFENWTYNGVEIKEKQKDVISDKKKQYLNLMNNLRNNTLTDKIKPTITINKHNTRKLSGSSSISVRFYNPLMISNQNKFKLADNYLSNHEELIPIIVLQADGMQVLDTIAHLSAFNDFYNLSNFGTSPYIYCASSAALPGLSLALNLSKNINPIENLNQLGKELYRLKNIEKEKQTNNDKAKKKCCCSSNYFKLFWLGVFGCCIDYDDETVIDSMFNKIKDSTANNVITNTMGLTKTSDIKLPNLIIEDINTSNGIVEQVLQANNNTNVKARNIQIKLFTDPVVSVIKKYIANNKESKYSEKIEKGVDFISNTIKSNDLSKITDKEEIQFIQNNNLHDSTTNRLVIILSSNVDNNNQITNDANGMKIEYKEIECNKLKNKLRAIRINIFTHKSVTNPNYSLEEKYNNIKSMLNNSEEFLYIINGLPQNNSIDNSLDINNNTEINNIIMNTETANNSK